MHTIINILPDLIKIILGIFALLLLWSPIFYLVLSNLFAIFGKKMMFYSLLSKIGFEEDNKHRSINFKSSFKSLNSLTDESHCKSIKHGFPKDYHTNPRYCNSVTNSSYNPIGPGSWNKKI